MCIIAYRPKGATLTKKVLKNCYDNNGDGCGIAWPDDKGESMIVERGLFGFRKLWNIYRDIPKDKPVLLHFRIGTSGQIDEKNCHPFLINEKYALVHNGNIENKLGDKDDTLSDTNFFVEKVLRPIFNHPSFKKEEHFWSGFSFKWLMENSIDTKNKMVILGADGMATIYNESAGEWENEVWFSNKTYKEDRKSATSSTVEEYEENGWIKQVTTFPNNRKVYAWLRPVAKHTEEEIHLQDKISQLNPQIQISELY